MYLKQQLKDWLICFDSLGSSRCGYLSADTSIEYKLKKLFQKEVLDSSNVFNTDADAIVNTINCVGFMGKGLALEFSLRYPKLLVDYKEKCSKKEINIGKLYYYKEDNILIINFPTKKDYKFPSKLEWIEKGLLEFVNTYKK